MQIGGLDKRFGARDQFHAVLVRQPKIRQHHVEIFAFQQIHRRLRVLGNINVIALLQRRAQAFARRLLVVHD